jgi:hypothetical protein
VIVRRVSTADLLRASLRSGLAGVHSDQRGMLGKVTQRSRFNNDAIPVPSSFRVQSEAALRGVFVLPCDPGGPCLRGSRTWSLPNDLAASHQARAMTSVPVRVLGNRSCLPPMTAARRISPAFSLTMSQGHGNASSIFASA